MENVFDRFKVKLQEFKEEEFENPLIVECRRKVAAFGEKLLFTMEKENVSEEDVYQLMGIFSYITEKYLETLPEVDGDVEEIDESCTMDEIKEKINKQKTELNYVCEYFRLIVGHIELARIFDFDKMKEQSKLLDEKLKKISEEELEKRFKDFEKEWDKDPFVFDLGANVSRIRLFEELMGKQPELEAVWKELEEAASDE